MKKRTSKWVKGALAGLAVLGVTWSAGAVNGPQLQVGKFAVEEGVFNVIFAKELCSCQFVDGLSLDECEARDNLPAIAHKLVDLTVDTEAHTVTSTYKERAEVEKILISLDLPEELPQHVGGGASAKFDPEHPEFGCVLTSLPEDDPQPDPQLDPQPDPQ